MIFLLARHPDRPYMICHLLITCNTRASKSYMILSQGHLPIIFRSCEAGQFMRKGAGQSGGFWMEDIK